MEIKVTTKFNLGETVSLKGSTEQKLLIINIRTRTTKLGTAIAYDGNLIERVVRGIQEDSWEVRREISCLEDELAGDGEK